MLVGRVIDCQNHGPAENLRFGHPAHTSRVRMRRGIVTLEFLGVFPLLLIFGLSIAQFSMAFRLNQRVVFASRYGAKLAAEMPRTGSVNVGNFNSTQTRSNLKARIDSWLASSGLSPASEVTLEHNVCGAGNGLQRQLDYSTASRSVTEAKLPPLPDAWHADNVCYVRVTVAVPVVPNVPNMLKTFGLNWDGVTFRHSTVFRMETDNQPPVPQITVASQDLPSGVRLANSDTSADSGNDLSGTPVRLRLVTSRSGSFDLTLSGKSSHDAEDALSKMTFKWDMPGAAQGSTRGASVRMKFDAPKDSTVVQKIVTLTVTDSCQCSSKTEVPVELTRELAPPPSLDDGPT